MKRFYKHASAGEGYELLLDGKPARTPGGAPLRSPNAAIAAMVAEEWNAVEGEVRFEALPITRVVARAHEIDEAHRTRIVEELTAYIHTDLLVQRADEPEALVARQRAAWDPMLRWFEGVIGHEVGLASGIIPIRQPEAAETALERHIRAYPDMAFSALDACTRLTGSVVLGVGMLEGQCDGDTAFRLSMLDELFQREHWGEDEEALCRDRETKRQLTAVYQLIRNL